MPWTDPRCFFSKWSPDFLQWYDLVMTSRVLQFDGTSSETCEYTDPGSKKEKDQYSCTNISILIKVFVVNIRFPPSLFSALSKSHYGLNFAVKDFLMQTELSG